MWGFFLQFLNQRNIMICMVNFIVRKQGVFMGKNPAISNFYMGHILGKYKYHIETEYFRNIRSYFVKESIIQDHDIPKKWI